MRPATASIAILKKIVFFTFGIKPHLIHTIAQMTTFKLSVNVARRKYYLIFFHQKLDQTSTWNLLKRINLNMGTLIDVLIKSLQYNILM